MAVTPRLILRAPIHFDAPTGEQLHAPMVLAAIGAHPVRLILDTGSDVHVLTHGLAERAGLPLEGVDPGTDHAGEVMDSWIVGDVEVTLPESSDPAAALPLHDVVAIPAPGAFEARGIAGILSPQRLYARAFAVLDLIDAELLVVDGAADDVRGWLVRRDPRATVLTLEGRTTENLPIVDAAVEPFPPQPILLNSGGRHTEFAPVAVPGLAGGTPTRIGTGVSGAPVMGTDAGPGTLRIGELRVPLPSMMLREGLTEPAGMVGMDVLRGTVLAIGPDRSTPVLWQVPGERLGEAPRAGEVPG